MAVAGRIVTKLDVFAQASMSHLGETSRNTPRFILELSLKRRALVLREILSRQARGALLSENSWELQVCRYSCSPSEEPHIWAKSGLAQARRARLSESS